MAAHFEPRGKALKAGLHPIFLTWPLMRMDCELSTQTYSPVALVSLEASNGLHTVNLCGAFSVFGVALRPAKFGESKTWRWQTSASCKGHGTCKHRNIDTINTFTEHALFKSQSSLPTSR